MPCLTNANTAFIKCCANVLEGCFTTFTFALALASCAGTPPAPSDLLEQPNLGVYITHTDPAPVPAEVQKLVETVIPRADVIRGFWAVYQHPGDPGYRVNIQINCRIWVEILPSKQITKFFVESRGFVRDEPGSIVLRLRNPGAPPNPAYIPLEGFIPDVSGQATLFRTLEHGTWGDWQSGVVKSEFK